MPSESDAELLNRTADPEASAGAQDAPEQELSDDGDVVEVDVDAQPEDAGDDINGEPQPEDAEETSEDDQDDEEQPEEKADDADPDPDAALLAKFNRIFNDEPAEPAEPASPAAPAAPAAAKPAADPATPADDAIELDDSDKALLEKAREEFGDSADQLIKPLVEKSAKLERALKSVLAERQQRQVLQAYESAQNLGGMIGTIAAKGFEEVYGKVGRYDPKTDSYAGTTPAQMQVIRKLISRTATLREKAYAGGEEMTIDEALQLAHLSLVKGDAAFKPLTQKADVMEKRSKQITAPPSGSKPAAAKKSADPLAKAKAKAKAWYAKNK